MSNREAGDLRRHRAHYDVTVMEDIDAAAASNAIGMIACESVLIGKPQLLMPSGW